MSELKMKKQALLIGINDYQILPELKFARQDAEAVEQSLKQNYCFSDNDIMLLTDAKPGLLKPSSRGIILTHLERLANQELDLFIFGFWGHGVVRNGQRYLCPLNAMPDAIEDEGVPFDVLMDLLTKIRAKNMCLILDCCQKVHDRGESETFSAEDQKAIENAARDIALRRKEKKPEFISNVAILNSCKEGQSAYEWDSRHHGIFTAHLLDAMNRRFDSVSKIVSYVSSNVEKTALELGKSQTPLCSMEGDIPLPVNTYSSPLVTGDVFISYRHCNADLVAPIEAELKKRGISYFIDRDGVNYGMDYSEAISQAVLASKLLLLVWTPDVKESDDIVSEVVMAKQAKKIIIPYKIGTFDISDHHRLWYHLSHLSRYDISMQTPETVTELIDRVVQQLKGNAADPTASEQKEPQNPQCEGTYDLVSAAPEKEKQGTEQWDAQSGFIDEERLYPVLYWRCSWKLLAYTLVIATIIAICLACGIWGIQYYGFQDSAKNEFICKWKYVIWFAAMALPAFYFFVSIIWFLTIWIAKRYELHPRDIRYIERIDRLNVNVTLLESLWGMTLHQYMFQRILGTGGITLFSNVVTAPTIRICDIGNIRSCFDDLIRYHEHALECSNVTAENDSIIGNSKLEWRYSWRDLVDEIIWGVIITVGITIIGSSVPLIYIHSLTLIFIAIYWFGLIWTFIDKIYCTKFTLNKTTLIKESGLLSKKVSVFVLRYIEDCDVSQNLWQRIIGNIGNITLYYTQIGDPDSTTKKVVLHGFTDFMNIFEAFKKRWLSERNRRSM